jgi:hypothetical protein
MHFTKDPGRQGSVGDITHYVGHRIGVHIQRNVSSLQPRVARDAAAADHQAP